jgi:hypothetical protein
MLRAGCVVSCLAGLMLSIAPGPTLTPTISFAGSAFALERFRAPNTSIRTPTTSLKVYGGGEAPGFSVPLYRAPHAPVSSVPNPLVPSGFRTTADYSYLYTGTWTDRARPGVTSYRYAPDSRALFAPTSGAEFVASAYSWKFHSGCQTVGAGSLGASSLPVTIRASGHAERAGDRLGGNQKHFVPVLESASAMLGDRGGQWRLNPGPRGLKLSEVLGRSPPPDVDLRFFCRNTDS